MLAVPGYYDGVSIQPLDELRAKANQKVIITVLDEFIDPAPPCRFKGLRGVLSEYADSALTAREEGALEQMAKEKYGNP